ncbi:RDD family protein [Solirubrobacter phytolaccae]|uniref:RDD family protein n=1 Tax=Solirubrobacter phytolaccae TaxID=1404360 RepID=A0A9X3NF06_9ACTN|nr:RDD family protein [Solirubrobacter phytolaccae]MDA0183772.1 RDD family protein [Solirubrobacter phytolaccae]
MPPFAPEPQSQYLHGTPYSSWRRRVAAYLVDFVVLLVVYVALLAAAWVVTYVVTDDDGTAETWSVVALWALIPIVTLPYYALTMRRRGAHNGQTWGKQALKIRVVRQTGEPVTAGFALLREMLVKNLLMGLCGIVQLIDFAWPIWDDHRQSWHDKIVSTFVVRA